MWMLVPYCYSHMIFERIGSELLRVASWHYSSKCNWHCGVLGERNLLWTINKQFFYLSKQILCVIYSFHEIEVIRNGITNYYRFIEIIFIIIEILFIVLIRNIHWCRINRIFVSFFAFAFWWNFAILMEFAKCNSKIRATNVESAMQSTKCDCFILIRMIVINRIFENIVIYVQIERTKRRRRRRRGLKVVTTSSLSVITH